MFLCIFCIIKVMFLFPISLLFYKSSMHLIWATDTFLKKNWGKVDFDKRFWLILNPRSIIFFGFLLQSWHLNNPWHCWNRGLLNIALLTPLPLPICRLPVHLQIFILKCKQTRCISVDMEVSGTVVFLSEKYLKCFCRLMRVFTEDGFQGFIAGAHRTMDSTKNSLIV